MAECIERKAFKQKYLCCGYLPEMSEEEFDRFPTADVAPVVHGRWEQVKEWATKAKYRCSVCGREIMSAVKVNIEKYPYCHCGAKMDGGVGDALNRC